MNVMINRYLNFWAGQFGTIRSAILVITFIGLIACEKRCYDTGEGLEIYLTEFPYTVRPGIDYRQVSFDTLLLQETPILRYNDLQKYDTLNHKLTLRISHDSLRLGDAGVYGRMFVVTLDREPVYCGFKWPVISSVGCPWVFIEEPYEELDQLQDNEIIISFNSMSEPDPRKDRQIIERLKLDHKID
jgi:hypothetical protein